MATRRTSQLWSLVVSVIGPVLLAEGVSAYVPEWIEPTTVVATPQALPEASLALQQRCSELVAQLQAVEDQRRSTTRRGRPQDRRAELRADQLCSSNPQQGIDRVRAALKQLRIKHHA